MKALAEEYGAAGSIDRGRDRGSEPFVKKRSIVEF
jgi:hypothetical protein